MNAKVRDATNGNALLKLYLDKTLSFEQLEIAARIIGQERERYSNKDEQDKAAEARAHEIVAAVKACKTPQEIENILKSYDATNNYWSS